MIIRGKKAVATMQCVRADQEVTLPSLSASIRLERTPGHAPEFLIEIKVNLNPSVVAKLIQNASLRPGAAMSSANTGPQRTRGPAARAASSALCTALLMAES